eukprot:00401.XXX_1748_1612_1 [CDS] Oithona nana genome sequencing.
MSSHEQTQATLSRSIWSLVVRSRHSILHWYCRSCPLNL